MFAALGDLSAELIVLLALAALVCVLAGGIGAWQLFGKGPRRNRACRACRVDWRHRRHRRYR